MSVSSCAGTATVNRPLTPCTRGRNNGALDGGPQCRMPNLKKLMTMSPVSISRISMSILKQSNVEFKIWPMSCHTFIISPCR